MNKLEKTTIGIAIILSTIAIVIGLYAILQSGDLGTLSRLPNSFAGTATNTSSTITTASSEILARNVDRRYAAIVNDGGNPIYLALVDDAVASSTSKAGIRLNANGGSIEFDNQFPYAGSVQAITASGTSTVTVTRY